MGQLAHLRGWYCFLGLLCTAIVCGCDKPQQPERPARQGEKTIASLVPAVTDMLLQMKLGDRLVGVSNYDPPLSELSGVARVGDYHTVDWEKLTEIRPKYLVIPRQKEETAPAFRQRASGLGITLIDTHADRLDDIYTMVQTVGNGIGESEKSDDLVAQIKARLLRVRQRAEGRPAVRVLIVMDENAQFIVGPRNFLDDLLKISGGVNVAESLGKDYPKIDAEKLLQLDPDAIIQLMPDAPPQVIDSAKAFWRTLPSLRAVRDGRVYLHTDWYLLIPSARVADVANKMVDDLHPLTDASQPATTVTR